MNKQNLLFLPPLGLSPSTLETLIMPAVINGHGSLETWFDRPLATGVEDSFGLSPDSFPQIITSRSLKNTGGGYLINKRTIWEVKVDAVQWVLEELTAPEQEIVVDTTDQMARFKRLRQLSGD